MRDGNRGGGGFRRDFGPREMHKATCSECGNECEVPFKPIDGKPVFCRECYKSKKKFWELVRKKTINKTELFFLFIFLTIND